MQKAVCACCKAASTGQAHRFASLLAAVFAVSVTRTLCQCLEFHVARVGGRNHQAGPAIPMSMVMIFLGSLTHWSTKKVFVY